MQPPPTPMFYSTPWPSPAVLMGPPGSGAAGTLGGPDPLRVHGHGTGSALPEMRTFARLRGQVLLVPVGPRPSRAPSVRALTRSPNRSSAGQKSKSPRSFHARRRSRRGRSAEGSRAHRRSRLKATRAEQRTTPVHGWGGPPAPLGTARRLLIPRVAFRMNVDKPAIALIQGMGGFAPCNSRQLARPEDPRFELFRWIS